MKTREKDIRIVMDIERLDSQKEKKFLEALSETLKTLKKLKDKKNGLFIPF
ncbi:MAG TPA: hypothetical protein VNZ49_16440 [Bacteroidia bacterium]|jgi:hypothetical protein|nr:hypothetical protein [Bacteroidia bacterium]